MKKKIITVIGATGAQGGGFARAILNDPNSEFSVRAITRDPDSDKAKELEKMGAEVIWADVDDVASLEAAFSDAYGAFLVSFFWAHKDAPRELQQIKNMAVAAKNARLEHAIYSTLEDTRKFIPLEDDRMPTIHGKYKVPHLDVKGEAEHFFTDLEVPVTFMITSPYWENFTHIFKPIRQEGQLILTLSIADKLFSGIDPEDIGKCAYGIFRKGDEYIGKKVGVAGEHLTGEEYAAIFTEVLGEKVTYKPRSIAEFRAIAGDEAANSFVYICDFNKEHNEARSCEFSRSVNPELLTFKQWLEINKHRMAIN